MALIQCTRKLLDELPPAESRPHKPTLLGDWHANLIRIERRKCVLFTNDETLFSLFVPKLTKPNFQNLTAVFTDNLIRTLKNEGLDKYVAQILTDYENNLLFSKTSSRSVLGSMNDIVNCISFLISRHGGLEALDPLELNREMNRLVLLNKPFHDAIQGIKEKLAGTFTN